MKRLKKPRPEASKTTRQPKKLPSFRENLSNYLVEYSRTTGIHGVKYLGQKHRPLIEKFCWLIVFGAAFYGCTYLIIQSYIKWETTPVLVTLAQKSLPIWQIPFPAITICPENKARQKAYNYTEAYRKMKAGKLQSLDEQRNFSHISLVCEDHLYPNGNKTLSSDPMEFLTEVGPQLSKLFMMCRWQSYNHTCDTLFKPTLTEDGICFTFNMLDKTELFTDAVYFPYKHLSNGVKSEGWSLEDGYPPNATRDARPHRILSSGLAAGFFVLLVDYGEDLDYLCHGAVLGYKILFHNPLETPRISNQFLRVPHNSEFLVNIMPEMITTAPGLETYHPKKRQCYFSKERQLYFFRTYTQHNCQVECLANYTLLRCGCVAYHMPRENTTKICGSGSHRCMKNANNELLLQEMSFDAAIGKLKTKNKQKCDCLPECVSLSYKVETSQSEFYWKEVLMAYRSNMSEFPDGQFTRFTMMFKEAQFVPSERSELYGFTSFISKCGGLLNLFAGFSFISFVEIIYFLSLRICSNIRKYGLHFWSGSKQLIDTYINDYNK